MHCKQFHQTPRRIAILLRALAIVTGLTLAAESPAVRLSAPSLAWILAPGGSQVIEITGIPESPRAGRAVGLPSAAWRSWAAPDSNSVILRLDTGLYLFRANDPLVLLTELAPEVDVTAAWDRASAGFALCWAEICQGRGANGALRSQWEVAAATRAVAFSVEAGLVSATPDNAVWRTETSNTALEIVPAAAAFRAGTQELWLVDARGHVTGRDRQGRRTGEGELVENPLGLVSSADGKSFFSANAEGAAAAYSLDAAQTTRVSLEDTVEGVWAAPGPFAVRLHESAKRPIAIWNGETGTAGWMPAANFSTVNAEVRQ